MLVPSKARVASLVMSMRRSSGKAQSSSSIAGPLRRLERVGNLEQAQLDGGVGAEHLAAGDAEQQRVADLPGGAGDGDLDGSAHEIVSSELGGEAQPRLGHRSLQVVVDRAQELLGRLVLLIAADEQRQVFWSSCHFLDGLDADTFQGLGECSTTAGVSVHSATVPADLARPGENRRDRVCRGRFCPADAGGSGA